MHEFLFNTDNDYGATWRLGNIFSKEGRAENKLARAQNKRERAENASGRKKERLMRGADRLAMKSSNLTDKTKNLAPTFKNSKRLWAVRYPWKARPPRKGWLNRAKVLDNMAKGYQPAYQFINSEYRATILAAFYILQHAWNAAEQQPGFEPYTAVSVAGITPTAKGRKDDAKLLSAVRKLAQLKGEKKPDNLRRATAYMQKQVQDYGLESAAWSYRALLLNQMAQKRSETSGKIFGTALAVGAAALGTIATAGVAGPVLVGAAIATGAGASAVGVGTQMRNAKLKGEWRRYQLEVQNALKQYEDIGQTDEADQMQEATESLEAEVQAAADAKERKAWFFLGGCTLLSIGMLVASRRFSEAT